MNDKPKKRYTNNRASPFNCVMPNGQAILFANGDVYETADAMEQEYLQHFVEKKRISVKAIGDPTGKGNVKSSGS